MHLGNDIPVNVMMTINIQKQAPSMRSMNGNVFLRR